MAFPICFFSLLSDERKVCAFQRKRLMMPLWFSLVPPLGRAVGVGEIQHGPDVLGEAGALQMQNVGELER